MRNVALFVFNGDPICFVHVLLNGLDMAAKGDRVAIVMEGAATKLLPSLSDPAQMLHPLWEKAKAAGIVAGVCKACAAKMQTTGDAKEQDLPLLGDMNGHPSMAGYLDAGFTIITF